MNHTKSGCIAIGSENSRARLLAEAEFAKEKDSLQLLLLTDEGRKVLISALNGVGCAPGMMTEDGLAESCDRWFSEICQFIRGMKFMFDQA